MSLSLQTMFLMDWNGHCSLWKSSQFVRDAVRLGGSKKKKRWKKAGKTEQGVRSCERSDGRPSNQEGRDEKRSGADEKVATWREWGWNGWREGVRPLVCETGLTSAVCVWVYASVITRQGGSWRLARYPLHTQKTQTPLVRRSERVHRSASCDSYVSHCAQITLQAAMEVSRALFASAYLHVCWK